MVTLLGNNNEDTPSPEPKIFSKYEIELDNTIIENAIKANGYTQLIINVTENCNLRCKYCAYSGIYTNNRSHGSTYMERDIAEKVLQDYYRGYCIVKQVNPGLKPAVSFYGGEPTLAFELLKSIIPSIRKLFGKTALLNITTNGTTLTHEMIEFFIDNEVILSFSLNGDQEEHNRMRVYPDGKGSFEKAWYNMQKVRHADPNYYRDHCGVMVTYDYGTDLYRLYEFLSSRGNLLPKMFMFSQVSPCFTDWYSQYTQEDRRTFFASYRALRDIYFKQLLEEHRSLTVLGSMYGHRLKRILNRSRKNSFQTNILPFTGSCIPGSKICAYPNGSYHICERINQHFPIGHVNYGLDFDAIRDVIVRFRHQIYPECYNCPIKRLCPSCWSSFAGEGEFKRDPDTMCKDEVKSVIEDFGLLYSLLEGGLTEDTIMQNNPVESNFK
jgi:uncharacterized protein